MSGIYLDGKEDFTSSFMAFKVSTYFFYGFTLFMFEFPVYGGRNSTLQSLQGSAAARRKIGHFPLLDIDMSSSIRIAGVGRLAA